MHKLPAGSVPASGRDSLAEPPLHLERLIAEGGIRAPRRRLPWRRIIGIWPGLTLLALIAGSAAIVVRLIVAVVG